MFYGEYQHNIDNKGRLIIPSRIREVLKDHYVERLFVTRGLEKCLFVFTEEEWRLQERKFKEASFTRREARMFNRLFFSGACEAGIDKQGRILVPQYLMDFAGIKEDVFVVGVSDRFEIWSADRWKEFFETSLGQFEDVAETILDPKKGGDLTEG